MTLLAFAVGLDAGLFASFLAMCWWLVTKRRPRPQYVDLTQVHVAEDGAQIERTAA
jgi:hypothetical protein